MKMAAPAYSVKSGNINGAIWDGKYGLTPSIKKPKRTKEGVYVKDDDGKQVYTDFFNKNDLLHLSYVARKLYDYLNEGGDTTTKPQTEELAF